MKNNRNWKQAFFILLGSLVILVAVMLSAFLYLVLGDPPTESTKLPKSSSKNTYFMLSTNKAGVNNWIHDELVKTNKKVKNISYDVIVDDYIYFKGNLIVFNRELPFQMVFEPRVNENEGLTLKEREVSLGMLNLPGEIVLGLLDEQFTMPEWVTIHPSEHAIDVDVKRIQLDNNMEISIKTFDLERDKIELNLKR